MLQYYLGNLWGPDIFPWRLLSHESNALDKAVVGHVLCSAGENVLNKISLL